MRLMHANIMSKFSVGFPWREEGGREGCVGIEIEALHPREYYREHYGAFEGEHIDCQSWERHARIYAHCARSLVAFMDATGLQRSDAFSEALVEGNMLPAGHDHSKLWRVSGTNSPLGWKPGQFLLTTEPYRQIHTEVETWCQKHRWDCRTMPPSVGLWWPTGEDGTRLVLISPPDAGVDLTPLLPLLSERMPAWIEPEKSQ
jgi:hypothetical protein